LEDNVDKNECPFCGAQFVADEAEMVRLPAIKKKRMHWWQANDAKLIARLSAELDEIDWTIFNNPNYFKLMQKREVILQQLNKKLEKFVRLLTQKRKNKH